jgi:hypothetical protein
MEAKIETLGIGKGSVFATIHGEELVKDTFRSGQMAKLDGLEPFNWMRTTREEWELDGFRVAIDRTLFWSWL